MDDAHPVAEQGAAAGPRRGIDGDDADGLAARAPGRDQRGAQGGFADTRRSRDTHDMGPRLAPRRVEQVLRRLALGITLQAGKRRGQRPLAVPAKRGQRHSVLSGPPSAACAAASRAIGTR